MQIRSEAWSFSLFAVRCQPFALLSLSLLHFFVEQKQFFKGSLSIVVNSSAAHINAYLSTRNTAVVHILTHTCNGTSWCSLSSIFAPFTVQLLVLLCDACYTYCFCYYCCCLLTSILLLLLLLLFFIFQLPSTTSSTIATTAHRHYYPLGIAFLSSCRLLVAHSLGHFSKDTLARFASFRYGRRSSDDVPFYTFIIFRLIVTLSVAPFAQFCLSLIERA